MADLYIIIRLYCVSALCKGLVLSCVRPRVTYFVFITQGNMGPPGWTVEWGKNLLDSVQKMIDAATEKLSKDLSDKIASISIKADELVARVTDQDVKITILQNNNASMFNRLLDMETRSMTNNL